MTEKKRTTPFYLIDTSSEFYRPIGLRIGICIGAALWLALEIYGRDPFWLVISGATAVYCVFTLLIAYKPPEPPPARPADEPEDEAASDEKPDQDITPSKEP